MINNEENAFGDISIEAQARVQDNYLHGRRLRIAILGPNLDNIHEAGTLKRYQIRDALKDDGHAPFFPECFIDTDDSTQLWIEIERQLLIDPEVSLVIILHTEKSFGAFTEIANFVSVPEIHRKTAILFPHQLYTPGESLPANTVQGYYVRKIYTVDELEKCHLVAECRKLVSDRLNENWAGLSGQEF